jgi:hypothetical protein
VKLVGSQLRDPGWLPVKIIFGMMLMLVKEQASDEIRGSLFGPIVVRIRSRTRRFGASWPVSILKANR